MKYKDDIFGNVASNDWILNCREATRLTLISEQEPISLKQRIALSFHLKLCKLCKLFKVQSSEINASLKANAKRETQMSATKKEEMKQVIKQLY